MRPFPVFDTYMSYNETGQVLIMDEGTNSLDAETEQQILMNLIKQKIIIIAVSHDKKL